MHPRWFTLQGCTIGGAWHPSTMASLMLLVVVGGVALLLGFVLGAFAAGVHTSEQTTDVDLLTMRAWTAEDAAEAARKERDELSLALHMAHQEKAAVAAERDLERAGRLRLEARHETTAIIRKPTPDGHP